MGRPKDFVLRYTTITENQTHSDYRDSAVELARTGLNQETTKKQPRLLTPSRRRSLRNLNDLGDFFLSGWRDLNPRPLDPASSATPLTWHSGPVSEAFLVCDAPRPCCSRSASWRDPSRCPRHHEPHARLSVTHPKVTSHSVPRFRRLPRLHFSTVNR